MQNTVERKVSMPGFAGAATTLLFWLLGFFVPDLMAAAPVGLEAAMTVIIMFVTGYMVPSVKGG